MFKANAPRNETVSHFCGGGVLTTPLFWVSLFIVGAAPCGRPPPSVFLCFLCLYFCRARRLGAPFFPFSQGISPPRRVGALFPLFCRARRPGAPLFSFSQGYFAAPAASFFLDAQKETKKALGDVCNRRFGKASRLHATHPYPLCRCATSPPDRGSRPPRTPIYEGHPFGTAVTFRRVEIGVVPRVSIRPHRGPGGVENFQSSSSPPAPGCPKPTLPRCMLPGRWGHRPLLKRSILRRGRPPGHPAMFPRHSPAGAHWAPLQRWW